MASKNPQIRNIKIKTGVVKRYGKERLYYIKEKNDQEGKIEKMRQAEADSHDIDKQVQVLQESEMMIPDCLRRLKTSWEELNLLLEQGKDLAEAVEYKDAQAVLEEQRTVVKT